MTIDKETKFNEFYVTFPATDAFRRVMIEKAKEYEVEGQPLMLSFNNTYNNIIIEKCYFNKESSSIIVDGVIENKNCDDVAVMRFNLPITDTVLIDLLSYATNKLNKLKSALESLK